MEGEVFGEKEFDRSFRMFIFSASVTNKRLLVQWLVSAVLYLVGTCIDKFSTGCTVIAGIFYNVTNQ